MQTKKATLSGYGELIHEATSAPYGILKILERIMRDEIFHSTLDWQTKNEFFSGARKAYRMYQKNPQFYDWEDAWYAASWNRTLAEKALQQATTESNPAAVAETQKRLKLAQESYEVTFQNMQHFA